MYRGFFGLAIILTLAVGVVGIEWFVNDCPFDGSGIIATWIEPALLFGALVLALLTFVRDFSLRKQEAGRKSLGAAVALEKPLLRVAKLCGQSLRKVRDASSAADAEIEAREVAELIAGACKLAETGSHGPVTVLRSAADRMVENLPPSDLVGVMTAVQTVESLHGKLRSTALDKLHAKSDIDNPELFALLKDAHDSCYRAVSLMRGIKSGFGFNNVTPTR